MFPARIAAGKAGKVRMKSRFTSGGLFSSEDRSSDFISPVHVLPDPTSCNFFEVSRWHLVPHYFLFAFHFSQYTHLQQPLNQTISVHKLITKWNKKNGIY